MQQLIISENKLRQIIYEELINWYLINEGLWDDVKTGTKKLSSYVTKQFKSIATKWASLISDRIVKMTTIPDDIKKLFELLKLAMKKSGETFQLNDTLKDAKKLGEMGEKGVLALVQKDLEGPVHEKAKNANETKTEGLYFSSLYSVLREDSYIQNNERLNEDFGVSAVLGIGLAIMGGLPMLFKGLHKLAGVLGAENAAQLFEKAEHITHSFEQKTIDFIVPDKLSYVFYSILTKQGLKISNANEMLTFEEFQVNADKSEAMKKTQSIIYKIMLIYFAINGIRGVLHAGASLLGFVEGAASSIKGVELARGAKELAVLIGTASEV